MGCSNNVPFLLKCFVWGGCQLGREMGVRVVRTPVGQATGEGRQVVSCPDPTHSNEEKGLVFFEQFLGLSSEFWEANQNRSM